MRTLTDAQRRALALTDRTEQVRVRLEDPDGNLQDIGDLHGIDWLDSVEISGDIDENALSCTIELMREAGDLSLSPLIEASPLNRTSLGAYSPFIRPGQAVVIDVSVTPPGTDPDWVTIFAGRTEDDAFGGNDAKLRITARDLWSVFDKFIETARRYGDDDDPVPMQDVIQQLLDDNFGEDTYELVTIGDPDFGFIEFEQGKQTVAEALRAIVDKNGWSIRFLWNDAENDFRLTLYEPADDDAEPVHAFTTDDYFDVPDFSVSLVGIRNRGEIFYTEDGELKSFIYDDEASQENFGIRYLGLDASEDAAITTTAAATALITRAIRDTRDPKIAASKDCAFFWPVELGDIYRFYANNLEYDSNQDLAVTGFTHTIDAESFRTQLRLSGTPKGGFWRWLNKEIEQGPTFGAEILYFAPVHDDATGNTVSYEGAMRGSEAWVYEFQVAQPVPAGVWEELLEAPMRLTDVLIPDSEGKITDTFAVPPEGYVRLVRVRPYRVFSGRTEFGNAFDIVIYPKSAQAPVVEVDDTETGATGYAFLKLHDRGISVTSVRVQTQVGIDPPSALLPPARGIGNASVVKGRTMVAGEYEHEVALASLGRQAWIYFYVTLATGEVLTIPFPGFDQGRNPDFVTEPYFEGTVLHGVTGDADTISITIERLGSDWIYEIDYGAALPIDVSASDPDGEPGQGDNSVAVYRITLHSDPIADIDSNTLKAVRELTLERGTSGEPVWEMLDNWLTEPSVSSAEMSIELEASAAPPDYTARVWMRSQEGSSPWSDPEDVTGDLSPSLTAPPTTSTAYALATDFQRVAKTATTPIVTVEIRAEIVDDNDNVVATRTRTRQWYFQLVA